MIGELVTAQFSPLLPSLGWVLRRFPRQPQDRPPARPLAPNCQTVDPLSVFTTLPTPIGSMRLVYLPTWIVDNDWHRLSTKAFRSIPLKDPKRKAYQMRPEALWFVYALGFLFCPTLIGNQHIWSLLDRFTAVQGYLQTYTYLRLPSYFAFLPPPFRYSNLCFVA